MSDLVNNENNPPDGWKEKDYTLVFCMRESSSGSQQVLLGMKKRGFGMGKWNGMGGKIEAGETAEEGAKRELEEESGLVANELTRRGYLVFNMQDSRKIMKVHVYTCTDYSGEAEESEEMRPLWYDIDKIPFDKMWLGE